MLKLRIAAYLSAVTMFVHAYTWTDENDDVEIKHKVIHHEGVFKREGAWIIKGEDESDIPIGRHITTMPPDKPVKDLCTTIMRAD